LRSINACKGSESIFGLVEIGRDLGGIGEVQP
jgi:hypothetical protein